MELKIKILEIAPNIKNLKKNPTDIISISFMAENVVVKIDNIEKSINKDSILLLLKEFSSNERIRLNLIRNDETILGKGMLIPLPGVKWLRIFDFGNQVDGNKYYSNKTFSRKSSNFINTDNNSNINIKIKLEIQVNMIKGTNENKSKSRSKLKNSPKKINVISNINKPILTGSNIEEKTNNSILSSNISSNFNKYKSNQNASSYTATPGIKSPKYTSILIRSQNNHTNNNYNDSSRDNTSRENNIIPALIIEREIKIKNKKRTPSGKKYLCENSKYKTMYVINKNDEIKRTKSTEKTIDNNLNLENKENFNKQIEEKILDQNFQDIIKYDEMLRGKEITDFNLDNPNNNNSEKNSFIKNRVSVNLNNNSEKNIIIQNKGNFANTNSVLINANNSNKNNIIINTKSNNNINTNNNIYEYSISNNELNNKNSKDDFNKNIQNSIVSSVISSGKIVNSGCDIDFSVEDLSGSFSGYDNISKIFSLDEYKINYDIENENISKYENIKNDFILFYNKEYINSINEEMLALELQLMIDKILEMQNIYKRQSIIIEKNFEKYKKKLIFFQKKNLLMNKKNNKLSYEKLKNNYNEELNDLYYNNKKTNFYQNKNIFKTKELSLWNNLTMYLDEKESDKKNENNNNKNKFNNIFLFICNKNINNLNTLSKKFVSEFTEKQKEKEKERIKLVEKKNKLNNSNNNFYNDKRKNDLINNMKKKKFNYKNFSHKEIKSYRNEHLKGNRSNKLLTSNDTLFRKQNKKDIFLIKEVESEENSMKVNTSNNEIGRKSNFKNNEINGRNNAHKNGFNTVKSFSKKFSNKKC